MGKSYRKDAGNSKWRKKWQQKQNKKSHQKQEWERIVDTLADEQDRYDRSIGGINDYSYGM